MKKLILIFAVMASLLSCEGQVPAIGGMVPTFPAAASTSTLYDNLIGYYKLDEITGTTAYDATGTADLTNTSVVINQTGIVNTCYYWDGSTYNYLRGTPPYYSLTDQYLTVSLWLKFTDVTVTGQRILYSKSSTNAYPGPFMYYSTSGYMQVGYSYTGNATGGIMQLIAPVVDTWYNLTVTIDRVDGTKLAVTAYLNGEYVSDNYPGATLSTTAFSNDVMTVGALSFNYGNHTNAYIDDIKIWNRALTESEVAENYNNGDGLELNP